MIHFKIVTPERTVAEEEVSSVTLPVERGEVTILPNHIPYVGALEAGEIMLKDASGNETSLATSGGFVEFHDNALIVLADTAERAEEIDMERAEEARRLALEVMEQRIQLDDEEYARAAGAIEKELARLRVARKHRSKAGMFHTNGA